MLKQRFDFPVGCKGEVGTGDWFRDGVAQFESQEPGKGSDTLVPAGQYEEKILIDLAGGDPPDLAPVFTNMLPKLMELGCWSH